MTQAPVPLIVLSGRQDDVELVNRALRDGGHPVRCQWVTKLESLAETIDAAEPQLLFFFADSLPAPVRDIVKVKQQAARPVPLIVVAKNAEEAEIADALLAGAQDLVSLGQTQRLRSVAERELRAFRLERALNHTLTSANQYKQQLKAFMAGSVDAIAHVQEGILVDANQAWSDLFGYPQPDDLLGVPMMDLFEAASQAALKGALIACAKGQWKAEPVRVVARTGKGSLPLDVQLEPTAVDGEPAIKLSVPRPKIEAPEPEAIVEQVVHKDPATGFFHRRRFLEVLTDRLDTAPRSGVRALVYLRPDKFRELEDQIGPLATEDVLIQIADLLRELTQPQDLYGRFGGQVFTLFLERGSLRDVEAWAQNALTKIAGRVYESAHNTVSLTCTIGLAEVGPSTDRLDALLASAKRANQLGRDQGGNRVMLEQTSDESTRVQRFDELWVQQIKAALRENRFRLVHLPIASLNGEQKVMYDTLLRMVDPQGEEVAAAEFMPAAFRNRLLRAIDRWVIGASLSFCAHNQLDCAFIKLSNESIVDKTLPDWLAKAVESSGVNPGKLCFQVSEDDATQYLTQTQELAQLLNARGHLFAIEHFGVGRDSGRILLNTPMQYLKLDGSLMENLAGDQMQQEKVRVFITAASKRAIPVIAERVENANTMAVLFQLGAAYVQGHYVHEPEVVLADVATARR
ncbi:MAG TPA: EAL domain-containing protein [Gammaproteobacteria bacterium]|jgi:diguanylate cyclase (GGDEF)-like protein|nr:EAL domain-containing protein [Gammaproteobacteria bacterium]